MPEFKLTEDPSSESKITTVDNKLKEPGKETKDVKEVKNGKEVKEVKDFKQEGSLTTLKAPEKGDKSSKGKILPEVSAPGHDQNALQALLRLMMLFWCCTIS